MNRARITIVATALLLTSSIVFADYQTGVKAFQSGDFSSAVSAFRAVTEDQPDWPGGHMMLGWSYLRLNKNNEAMAALQKAYDLDSANPAIQMRLGEAYISAGRYADAVGFLSKINAASLPKEQQGVLSQMRAVALTKSGQGDRAVEEFRKAIAANPNDASLHYQHGTTALNAGQLDTAVQSLEKAVQLDGSDVNKKLALAKAAIKAGRMNKSNKSAYYSKAVSAASAAVNQSGTYDNIMLLGEAQLGAKNYVGASSTFQRAATSNANDWLPHYYIGTAQTATGSYSGAESALKTALSKSPSSSDQAKIWKALGFVYEKQKNYAEAKSAYQQGGDPAGVQRVQQNQETDKFNRDVDQENRKIQELEEEKRKLEEELKNLPGYSATR